MEVRVSHWGNSLGVRLPKAVVDELRLKAGQTVQVVVKEGKVQLSPVRQRKRYKLEELLADIDRLGQSAPEPVDWGPDVGAEIINDEYNRQ